MKVLMLLTEKLNIFTDDLSTGKKLLTDNGNILYLNLNSSAISFKIVHFECEGVFFRIKLDFFHEFAKYPSVRILCHYRSSLCLILKNACCYTFVAMVT